MVGITTAAITTAITATSGAINTTLHSMFEIGEAVVHPQYGVGRIVKLEEREFEHGKMHRYYEVLLPGGSTLWVPVDRPNSGLRRLAQRSDLVHCRAILKAPPSPLIEDGRLRQSDLASQLKKGTIDAQCEVTRDLSAFVSHKPAYGTIFAFLDAVRGALDQEWAQVEEISLQEAAFEISSLLDGTP